jgi:hypothetical protein
MAGRTGKRKGSAPDDPLDRLDAARIRREAAEAEETALVLAARESGHTWSAIGALYGLTKQGAQQRFRAEREHGDKAKAAG